MPTKCPKCDSDNTSDSKFCKECGTRLPLPERAIITKTLDASKEKLTPASSDSGTSSWDAAMHGRFLPGTMLADRYRIVGLLGKGGMDKVYRALDKKLNEEVALKLIKPEIASDKKTLERFQNELKLARKIRHSNVGGMYELLEDKGLHYITMEYVSSKDLKSFIRRIGQIPSGKAISIAMQVCEGLEEAHRLGVVHRDLKPSNIMIDKDGNARIMDFGIARSLESK